MSAKTPTKKKAAPTEQVQDQIQPRRLGLAIIVAVVIIAAGYWMLFGGVRIAGVPVSDSGLTHKLSQKVADYQKQTLTFTADGSQYKVSVASLGVTFDIPASVAAARRDHSLAHTLLGHEAPLIAKIDQNSWIQTFLGWSSSVETPVSNATVSVSGSGPTLSSASTGTRLDFGVTSQRLTQTLEGLGTGPTTLATYQMTPLVNDAQLEAVWPKVKTWLAGPVTLTDPSGQQQELSEAQIAKLVSVREQNADDEFSASVPLTELPLKYALSSMPPVTGSAVASLDQVALKSAADELAPKYYSAPVDAQLAWSNGTLQVTAPSQNGQQLDETAFIQRLTSALSSSNRTVELPITTALPDVREDDLASLGITELIGRGTSSWGISPQNRIHNILTGLARFKSVLVKPGEVFSFNKVLGPVDASTGYLPELSILVDKTVPEFGGGLCQVSSTAWRASLNAGLPTVSRTNHAYPVSYYFPIGTDATIYLPYPDMQWKNNTGHYILIQAYNQGNNVFFDYYGTLPTGEQVTFSRNQNMTNPVTDVVKLPNYVFNVQPDGTEDTVFYRQVTVNGQVQRTDRFFTRYQPASRFPHIAQ